MFWVLINYTDISIENILVPVEGSVLTGGLTYTDRRGTLIDWNLCFNAHGKSSNRVFKSGTPAFMAPVLLEDEPIPRRTLGHDMESFFAVIIWIATLDYVDEVAFQAKPLAIVMLDKKKTPMDIVNAKGNWFEKAKKFRKMIVEHFQPLYHEDGFITCLSNLRQILYGDDDDSEEMGSVDLMKEDLFRMCMKEMDDYLNEKKGVDEMQWIDSQASNIHSARS
jgi:hypothetical protein